MTIIYSPEFSGAIYHNLESHDGILYDTSVVNTAGLVGLIQMRLGIHYEDESTNKRLTAYYKAMSKYMDAHKDNILYASFLLSGLSTAKECLRWRDTLALAGWTKNTPANSGRLKVLQGVEDYFNMPGSAERLFDLYAPMAAAKAIFSDTTILIPCELEYLHPADVKLLSIMKEGGATIDIMPQAQAPAGSNLELVRNLLSDDGKKQISLRKDDDSFKIWHFETEQDALQYLAYADDKLFDVWINADNKALDNWLKMMGKPVAGSSTTSGAPQVSQLLPLGVDILRKPLNVSTLIQWLYSPVNPLDWKFRIDLADLIVTEGGYYNPKVMEFIGEEHENDIFLPDKDNIDLGGFSKNDLFMLVNGLHVWSAQTAMAFDENNKDTLLTQQMASLAGTTATFLELLDECNDDVVPYALVDSWMNFLYKAESYTQYNAQSDARFVVDSPAKVAGIAEKTIWCGFYNSGSTRLSYNFLSPSEIDSIKGYLNLWKEDNERAYGIAVDNMPFHHTSDKLVLVTVNKVRGEAVEKNPVTIRLEKQVKNLADFIEYPKFDESLLKNVEDPDNKSHSTEFQLKHPELIKWPDHISHTSLDELIQFPIDYVMEHIAHITSTGIAEMSDVKRTKGNVAHAIIEALFKPKGDGIKTKAADVSAVLSQSYDDVFANMVEANGAILNLDENKIERKLLKVDLRRCLDNLIQILEDNKLSVTGCERRLEQHIRLGESGADPEVHGIIDMTLEDSLGNPVVFDFKWTSSKSYYQGLIKTNTSSQLALYQQMLSAEEHKNVERVGYFLMPEGRLYSKSDFKGDFAIKIEPEDNSDLVDKMRNSYRFRKEQILAGRLENADGTPVESTEYGASTGDKNLFPLSQEKDGSKSFNAFGNYDIFKN